MRVLNIVSVLFTSTLFTHGFANNEVNVSVDLAKVYQTIQGFGVYAGPGYGFVADPKRDQFLEMLFGPSGLQLEVLRFTVYPDFTFPATPKNLTGQAEAEYWILKNAKERFGVKRLIASAWSPPYEWKTLKGQNTGVGMNRLATAYYYHYADYLANFTEWYNKHGLPLYAISPQNEPEYPAPSWDGCVWLPSETANLVSGHLRPQFRKRNITTKIMVGESGNWNLANAYLTLTFLLLNDGDAEIAASHGYSLPMFPNFSEVTYAKHVFPLFLNGNVEQWVTEASATDPYDPSMKKGIEFAVSLHNFLTKTQLNAYVFWLAKINGPSNEALIVHRNNTVTIHKAYDVYGHFSRFVKIGWVRVDASSDAEPVNDILVSAFKDPKSKKLAVILINAGMVDSSNIEVSASIRGGAIQSESVEAFASNATNRWEPATVIYKQETNSFSVSLEPMSVVTLSAQYS